MDVLARLAAAEREVAGRFGAGGCLRRAAPQRKGCGAAQRPEPRWRVTAAPKEPRCGRCSGQAGDGAWVHHLWIREDDGSREVELHMCARCGREFTSACERDEYLRLVLFG